MRDFRLKALEHFYARPTPTWGGNLGRESTSTTSITSCAPPKRTAADWSEVPAGHSRTPSTGWESPRRAQIPLRGRCPVRVRGRLPPGQREARGPGRDLHATWTRPCAEHEDLVREHWATIIPPNDNKLAALNSAVGSGGSFVCVPAGVKVEMPLQAYFRINTENMGQFERTLIICEEAPTSTTSRAARRRSTRPTRCTRRSSRSSPRRTPESATRPSRTGRRTSSTWSPSVPSRTRSRDDGVGRLQPRLEADDGSTRRSTCSAPKPMARSSRSPSPARASTGTPAAKIIHAAPRTSSSIFSKSISKDGGRATYRGLLEVADGASESRSKGCLRRAAPRRGLPLGHLPDESHRRERRRRRP